MTVPSSAEITTLAEARDYYRARLARAHEITRYDRRVTVVFEKDATHLFSVEVPDDEEVPLEERVERNLGGGRKEVRRFSLDRARLMDLVLPALSNFTVSVIGQGRRGQEKRLVHGPRLEDGSYMRVVLRPGPGEALTCVSAYPVDEAVWLQARRSKSARFPP